MTARHALQHLRNRPSLAAAAVVAAVAVGVCAPALRPVSALLVGWDLGVMVYGTAGAVLMRQATVQSIRQRARLLNPGNGEVLAGAMLAAVASLVAIVVELVQAHGAPGAGWSLLLSGATVLLSWSFIHLFFAQQYAHDYWLNGEGLEFPGNDQPLYDEFLYFSFTIGMTAQLSDVTTRSAAMRRLVLRHALLSFLFNTAILALGVNLAAGLFN